MASIKTRFTELDNTSSDWPCDYPVALPVKIKGAIAGAGGFGGRVRGGFSRGTTIDVQVCF